MSKPSNSNGIDAEKSPAGRKRSWLGWILKLTFLVLLMVVAAIAFLLIRPTSFDLSRFGETIDSQMTEALGREIAIDGAIVLVTGLSPSIRIEDVVVDQPADWPRDNKFARLESLETSINLSELFAEKIIIDDISIHGLQLSLERNEAGKGNWEGFAELAEDPEKEITTDEQAATSGIDLQFTELGGISVDDLRVTYRDFDTQDEQEFYLDTLKGSAKLGESVKLALAGRIFGLPLNGDFTGGTLTALRSRTDQWPVDLSSKLGESTVQVAGHLSTVDFAAPGVVDFDLDLPKPEQLVPLIGELPDFGSLRISGQAVRSSTDNYAVSEIIGTLGDTNVTGSVDLDFSDDLPKIDGKLKVELIDLTKFGTQNEAELAEQSHTETAAVGPDDPRSPADAYPDADQSPEQSKILPFSGRLQINVDEVVSNMSGVTVSDLELKLQLNEHDASANLGLLFGDAPLSGQLILNRHTGDTVGFDVELEGTDADLTPIISFYTGQDNIQGSFQRLQYTISGKGKTLRNAWQLRRVNLEVIEAIVVYQGEEEPHQFTLSHGSMQRENSEVGEIQITGTVRTAPFELKLGFHPGNPGTDDPPRLLQLDGKVADLEISASNELEQRPELGDSKFTFSLQGGSLDKLDSIYELNLPPLGPYSAIGVFEKLGPFIELRDVALKVGSSELKGSFRHEKRENRPLLTMDMSSQSLQLNDFLFDDWSPVNSDATKPRPASSKAESEEVQINDLLSHEALNQFDAAVKIDVGEVMSGSDRLGHGNLAAKLQGGRLEVSPLKLAIPGGSFSGAFSFQPKADRTVDWNLQLGAQRFELGILARRTDPDSTFSAIANADLNLKASGTPYDKPQLKTASGTLNVDICPRNLKAGALDLWATNLLVALLPKLDPKNESKINCLIGRLHLENGVIIPETLGMDTTTLRVIAEGEIDLVAERYDLVLTPHPKRPQLLSLELPLGVEGGLNAPEITMGKLPMTRTVGRVAKNTLLFPIKLITADRLPADGSDICPCLNSAKQGVEGEP